MSGDHTPNLDLEYLAPSQAQPEVIINDAWNKIDAFAADVGGLTVQDADSPHTVVTGVKVFRISGARVIEESDGVVLVEITGGGEVSTAHVGSSLAVEGLGDSPHVTVEAVSVLRFEGPVTVEEGSDGVALVIIDTPAAPVVEAYSQSAGWNSPTGAVLPSLSVAQDVLIPFACALKEVYILPQGGVGSCTVTVGKCALGGFPAFTDITGGVPPAIASSSTPYANSTLSGWTTALAQNDVIRLTLTANSNFTSIKIILRMG